VNYSGWREEREDINEEVAGRAYAGVLAGWRLCRSGHKREKVGVGSTN
jgi:hypothetical protein